jgi:PKD repeat protein
MNGWPLAEGDIRPNAPLFFSGNRIENNKAEFILSVDYGSDASYTDNIFLNNQSKRMLLNLGKGNYWRVTWRTGALSLETPWTIERIISDTTNFTFKNNKILGNKTPHILSADQSTVIEDNDISFNCSNKPLLGDVSVMISGRGTMKNNNFAKNRFPYGFYGVQTDVQRQRRDGTFYNPTSGYMQLQDNCIDTSLLSKIVFSLWDSYDSVLVSLRKQGNILGFCQENAIVKECENVVLEPDTNNHPPVAKFKAIPRSGIAELWVDFDASKSKDEDGNITRYEWSFGDGSKKTTLKPKTEHKYSQIGSLTVTLTVVDNQDAKDTAMETLYTTGKTSITELTATNTRTGNHTTITVKCSKNSVPVTVAISKPGSSTPLFQQNTTCNGFPLQLGPLQQAGSYQTTAKIDKPCNRCTKRAFFTVLRGTKIPVNEIPVVFSALFVFFVLWTARK